MLCVSVGTSLSDSNPSQSPRHTLFQVPLLVKTNYLLIITNYLKDLMQSQSFGDLAPLYLKQLRSRL